MRKKNKIILTLACLTTCMLILEACGKSAEEKSANEIYSHPDTEDLEEIANYEAKKNVVVETEKTKDDESISAEESVPWDNMSPINIKDFPAGIRGSVNENEVFFPDILFPSKHTTADGICRASLNDKDYNAYAYVETHARTIADAGGLYFEQIGDFIIYTKDSVQNIEIKDTAHDYLIHISVEIWGANDDFMDEYLLKNCEYIREQISGRDQSFTPEITENTEESAPTVLDENPALQTYIHNDGYAVIAIENFLSEDTKFYAVDSVGYTYEFPLLPAADTLYYAMDGDTIALYVDIADGKMKVDTDYEAYCNLYGEYTLTE